MNVHRPIQGEIKTCTVRRQAGKWYACVTVETCLIPPIPVPVDLGVGVDRNIVNLATLSDGTVLPNPRHLQHAEGRLALLQHRAGKKRSGSRNRKKANARVARRHAKVGGPPGA